MQKLCQIKDLAKISIYSKYVSELMYLFYQINFHIEIFKNNKNRDKILIYNKN